ncbi:hypothetical protein [Pseudoteredinibacter isoporae]|uniref:hypothetical protein n=1 Tax=Pseudoteredinibacter isoporae TaxID=570281 RepID=UPI003109C44F
MTELYEKLSIRELQAYGSSCFGRYCNQIGLEDEAVDELCEHLVSILIASDLPSWESDGNALDLCGRGEPLPVAIERKVPASSHDEFAYILDMTVEIGMADMYGALTEAPREVFSNLIERLLNKGVKLLRLESAFPDLLSRTNTDMCWGELYSMEKFLTLKNKLM